ncbi:hypothetical protein [Rhodobacter lacus]|uniref:Uncharacterized protein n=1 Tax=Rhodobacter lacus TaxID=1641972 RepID=A0ABW5A4G0_9RHOB
MEIDAHFRRAANGLPIRMPKRHPPSASMRTTGIKSGKASQIGHGACRSVSPALCARRLRADPACAAALAALLALDATAPDAAEGGRTPALAEKTVSRLAPEEGMQAEGRQDRRGDLFGFGAGDAGGP